MRSLVLALALMSLFSAIPARAQFLQTDLNTYQLPDPKRQIAVIVTPKGMFIAYSPNRSSTLAGFDPEQLKSGNSLSLFLAYAPGSQVPERLVLPGQGNQYRIRGTFTLILTDEIRVAVAMNTNGLPYVTIVNAQKGQESILGFVGQQPMVNLAGSDAIELLEADPLRRQYANVAPPYVLNKDNRISTLHQVVPAETAIGLLSPPDNPCLLDGVALRWDEQAAAEAEGKADGKEVKKRRVRTSSLSSFLFLNVTPQLMVGIHYDTGSFVAISQPEGDDKKTCYIRPLELRNRPVLNAEKQSEK